MSKTTRMLGLTLALAVSPLALSGAWAADKIKIGLAVANLQADFFNQIKQSVEKNAAAQGIEVITVDAKGDGATQVSQIQDLITQKVQALIYIPAGAAAASVPVKAAKAAGIPVVAVDRNPADAPGDTFIATNSVVAAKTLGDYVCKQTGGKGLVGGDPSVLRHPPIRQRHLGSTGAERRLVCAGWHWRCDAPRNRYFHTFPNSPVAIPTGGRRSR